MAQAAVLQSSVPASLGLNENNFCHNLNSTVVWFHTKMPLHYYPPYNTNLYRNLYIGHYCLCQSTASTVTNCNSKAHANWKYTSDIVEFFVCPQISIFRKFYSLVTKLQQLHYSNFHHSRLWLCIITHIDGKWMFLSE